MRNRFYGNRPYRGLVRIIFKQTLTILIITIVTVIALRSAGRGYIGELLSRAISKMSGLSWGDAQMAYYYYIGRNTDAIILVAIIIFFVLLFRLSLTWFMKYFNEIVAGVDRLAEESPDKITMCRELAFIEDKLNQVKEELGKRAKEVRDAEQRKNDLVVYLAHDIKTPLSSVIGYLCRLDETSDMSNAQKNTYIHIALDKAYRLENLINEFFEITRYNLQTVPMKRQTIDLYYLLVQMVEEAYPQLSAHGKRVEIQADEDMVVFGDPAQLARVFNNVLKNAIAYSEDDSVILIQADLDAGLSVVRFENDGSIPREKLDTIFLKYYRMDDARTTATGGSGLGLAIAKDIVVLHGGTIWAESLENRTVFIVKLPSAPDI